MVLKHAIFFLHVFQSCQEKSDLSYFKTNSKVCWEDVCHLEHEINHTKWTCSHSLNGLKQDLCTVWCMSNGWIVPERPPPFARPPVSHSGCLCHPLSVNFCNWQFNSLPLHGIIHHLGSCEGKKRKSENTFYPSFHFSFILNSWLFFFHFSLPIATLSVQMKFFTVVFNWYANITLERNIRKVDCAVKFL